MMYAMFVCVYILLCGIYDYEMVLLGHTISTMYHGIIFKSCKKTQYITMKCVIGEQTRKVCCPLT